MDPIKARVIQGRLNQIALEMSRKLIRMGFSIVIKESEDIGCAIVDADGWQFCEADTTPLQGGAAPWIVQGIKGILEERSEVPRPGDIYIHNDPYRGASHAPDIALVLPIFFQNELVAWSCAAAHHVDIGCSKPGTSVIDAVDEWAGGLRLRALPIRKEGVDNEPLWSMIGDNVRVPKLVIGDLHAQIAACELGAQRLIDLMDQIGRDEVIAAKEWYEQYSEQMLRHEIAAIPDGDYTAEGLVDGFPEDPNPSNQRLPLVVTLKVRGDSLEVDLSGTSPQLDNLPLNMPLQGTVMCSIFTAIRSVLLDSATHESVPQNRGLVQPIKVTAPEGSLVNPKFPAPTLARCLPAVLLTDTVIHAFAQVIPERCCAGCGALAVFSYSGVRDGDYWVHMDIHEGSYGARWEKDGMDAMDTLMTNTRCAPIEEIETECPIRCERWELNDDPVGHGKFRGGKGGIREFRYLTDGYFSSEADNQLQAPWGLSDGLEGIPSRMWIRGPDGDERIHSKQTGRSAKKGQVFAVISANGGGFGSPLLRDPNSVLQDLLDGFVTLKESRDVYGVVIDSVQHAVDLEKTAQLRLSRQNGEN